jgi:hypothetical protein
MTLIEALQTVPDYRAKRGRRYQLWVILLLIVLGTLNGCRSWAINLFRLHGETSITKAQRRVAHDIEALLLLVQ